MRRIILSAPALAAACSLPLSAQTLGEITGRVVDASSAALRRNYGHGCSIRQVQLSIRYSF